MLTEGSNQPNRVANEVYGLVLCLNQHDGEEPGASETPRFTLALAVDITGSSEGPQKIETGQYNTSRNGATIHSAVTGIAALMFALEKMVEDLARHAVRPKEILQAQVMHQMRELAQADHRVIVQDMRTPDQKGGRL